MASKRALLIGIDAYAHVRSLDGCVNDSRLMRCVLAERFGFPDGHIAQLLDGQATQRAIRDAFAALVAATAADDVVVIHFAGHGSQIRDREGDEPSGFDSTIMPCDTAREPGENRDITDDEIHLVLEALAAKTPNITVLVDACHSGTVTRDAFGAKSRGVLPDRRSVSELPPSPIPGGRLPRTRSGASGWLPLADKYVLIAGCRDDEESKEYFPPEGGGPHGALTYFLCHELRKAPPRATYRDVFEIVQARVNAYNRVQHPQMEGTADRTLFGADDAVPAPYVPVVSRVDQKVTLGAGSAQGVTVGSTWAVHAAGTKQHDATTALGTIVVRAVTPFSAEAEITDAAAPGAITAGTRAFETAHAFAGLPLTVQLSGAAAEAAFADQLRASSMLQVVAEDVPAAVRLSLLPARSVVSAGDPVPQAGTLDTPRWAVVDATGDLLMPLKTQGDEAVVVQNLEKIARFRRLLALDHPAGRRHLAGRVSIALLRPGPDGAFAPATPDSDGGLVAVDEGSRVRFRLTNGHHTSLFVAIVYLGTGSEITVPRQIELAAGTSFDLTGPVTFPPNYPFVDLGDPLRGVDSVETIKIVVTTEFVDFRGLEQAAVRSADAAAQAATPFAASLQRASGARTRAFTPETGDDDAVTVASDGPAWFTESRSFIVRRRATALPAPAKPGGAVGEVAIGHAVVSAPALTGTLGTGIGADNRDDTAGFATAALQQALAGAGVAMKQTFTIAGARHTGPATRSAAEAAPIELQLAPPPEGYGQMVLAADELGVVSWSFGRAAPATRSADGRPPARMYRIRSAVPQEAPGQPASRGVIGLVGSKVIKELVFPLLRPMLGAAGASAVHWLESTHWPYRVRRVTPDDYTQADAAPLTPEDWARMATGRALLLVHGTFSRSHMAFGALPKDYMAALDRHYEGRVFAFDHLFLSEDPEQNARWLVAQMPEGATLTLDIVCHSRGGLVSRVLSERQAALPLGSRRLRIGKVVLVGVPNAGTALADPAHVETLLDVFTNLLNFVPDSFGAPALSMLVEFAKLAAVGALGHLPGLQAMHPDGEFARRLNAPGEPGPTKYFAVASNVMPTEPGLRHFVRSRALDALLRGGNDFVVPSDGVFAGNGSSYFPVASPVMLEGEGAVAHTKYFADPRVRDQIFAWLSAP